MSFTIKIEGEFHDKEGDDREHDFGCDNKGNNEGEGKGGNKKTAESLAAREALKRIKEQGGKKQ